MRAMIVMALLALPGLALAQQTDKAEAERALAEKAAETAKAAASERKIADLEAKLQALLQEIQDLRGGKKVAARLTQEVKPGGKAEFKKEVIVLSGKGGKPLADEKVPIELRVAVSSDGKRIEKVVGDRTIVLDAATGKIIEQRVGGAKDGQNVEKRVVVLGDGSSKDGAHAARQTLPLRTFTAQPGQGSTFAFSGGDPNTVHLTRVTYTLTDAKQSKALDEFLKAFAKAKVLETKVEEDKLVVTTTPEVQSTVGQVVGLMTGKPAGGQNFKFSYTMPHVEKLNTWRVETVKPTQVKPAEPKKPEAK